MARFRIYLREIKASPKLVDRIIKATVALHNFIRTHNPDKNLKPVSTLNTAFMDYNHNAPRMGSRNSSARSNLVRDKYKEFLLSQIF